MRLKGDAVGAQDLHDLANHIVLPPQLPQRADNKPELIEQNLLHLVQDVIPAMDNRACPAWTDIATMLSKLDLAKNANGLDPNALKADLSTLSADDCLTLFLKAQNAGLLIRYNQDKRIVFETFELSAASESVMSTTGRLSRTFPGNAVSLSAPTFFDPSFQNELSDHISRLSCESVRIYEPTSKKAGSMNREERDTTNPGLVSDCLMTILCAIGKREDLPLVQKFIRDHVCWQDALHPWRRSPFWTLLRVSILRVLLASHGPVNAQQQYKLFMINIIARLLDIMTHNSVKPDLLSSIHVKLARRVHKFEQQFGTFHDDRILEISKNARKTLTDTWTSISANPERVSRIPRAGWEDATNLHLPKARKVLAKAAKPLAVSAAPQLFIPPPQSRLPTKSLPTLHGLSPGHNQAFALAEVEFWVEKHLESWTEVVLRDVTINPFDDLALLIEKYWSLAELQYDQSPLDKSNALLTVLELWVALDNMCMTRIPLLRRHAPEISTALLQPLLLPKVEQMRRLSQIEKHINERLSGVAKGTASIFDTPNANSLPIWYYNITPELQQLRHEIQQYDQQKRQRKLEELEASMPKYNSLVAKAEKLEHLYRLSRRNSRFHDVASCPKCPIERLYTAMKIDVDEKSLPEDDVQAKAAVFELAVPIEFAAWRDTTWYIIHTIGQRKSSPGAEVFDMAVNYNQLRSFVSARTRQPRLTLASRTKPFVRSHYSTKKLPTDRDAICVNNALQYDMLNRDAGTWLARPQGNSSFKAHCTLSLPPGPYANLDWAVRDTIHTTNEVMASQSDCTDSLEMREYVVFCSLRSGERLQWLNILREYGCSNLTFNNPAVTTLILQAIWEAGTPSQDDFRVAHDELRNKGFCTKLLEMLHGKLLSIESNWQEQHSMVSLIQIILRVLSLTADEDTEMTCHSLLRTARKVCLAWCRQIQVHMNNNSTQEDVQGKAVVQLLSAALSCYSTFDVDERHFARTLASVDDVATLAEAQVIVCDNTAIGRAAVSSLLKQSLIHHAIIAHKIEPYVCDLSRNDGAGLNQAVQQIWNGAALQPNWDLASSSSRSWLTNITVPKDGRHQNVHFNLLGGDLLVDGKPVGKIPSSIRSQPLFQQIFGPAILNVFASSMPGMDYTVSQHIQEHEVHIGARDGKVLIRACHGKDMLQALPQDAFANQLPAYFVQSFTHWLNEETGEVEFRPLERPWQVTQEHWKLAFHDSDYLQTRCQMRRGPERLLENQSVVGKSVTKILGTLDSASQCQIVLDDSQSSELKVYLRRYNLHFHVTSEGALLSLEYSSVVDPDQNIESMIGLRSKLVLRDVSATEDLQERRVIVPWGQVVVLKKDSHVSVSVPYGITVKQKYFVYSVDRHLRKLRGQQDVLSTLYKAYLHAITSFVLPDPFTGRTGTEESVSTLKEASLFSCVPLDNKEKDTLNLIASLTPSRVYYPQHKKVMQSVNWSPNLSPLSQHDDFLLAATSIYEHHSRTEVLFDLNDEFKVDLLSRGDPLLLERARKSNASVMKSGLLSDLTRLKDDDRSYPGRDKLGQGHRAGRVFEVASLIKEWPSRIATHTDIVKVVTAWKDVYGYSSGFFSLSSLQELSSLEFSKHFGSLYELCRRASRSSSTFPLMFRFCAIAIGADEENLMLLRTLLAFAFSGSFLNIDPPPLVVQYKLGDGSSPSKQAIMQAINRHALCYEMHSDYPSATEIEEFEKKEREQDTQKERLCNRITSIWPGTSVSVAQAEYQHLKTPGIVQECQRLFNEWHKNRLFLEHIQRVATSLASMQAPRSPHKIPASNMETLVHQHATHPRFTLIDLLQRRPSVPLIKSASRLCVRPEQALEDASQIKGLISSLNTSSSSTHSTYSETLRASVEALEEKYSDREDQLVPISSDMVGRHRAAAISEVENAFRSMCTALSPLGATASIVDDADLWPRLSEPRLLAQLSRKNVALLPEHWKMSLLDFGEKMASLQRAERITNLHHTSNQRSLWKELMHQGREGWDVQEYPSWLLLEIENNITIRPLQAKVAKEMINPSSGKNSVLQLNMGEGKSSVIVPMLATALADGTKLARVIVLKPLLRQTEQVLTQRLGGLLDQRVGHIPFSRKTKVSVPMIAVIQDTFQRYAKSHGVLVILPEEILSMQLMTRERMTSGTALGTAILRMHRGLKSIARDILDESDEILSVRSQLIYPVGSQHMLDGKNDRWQIAQAVLQRVNFHVRRLAASYPSDLELEYNGKSFPLLKFLRPGVGEILVEFLIEDAVNGRIAGLSFDFYSEDTREAVRSYISSREVSKQHLGILTTLLQKGPDWDGLLILRGLFAHEVLSFSLQRKRWLVEYGLDPRRCLMAVPYRAKGVPSTNSEFGHPDVGILLTCLSYYYTGLTLEQMYTCFTILSKDSNPQDVYNDWVPARDFPESLKSYEAVNLDDKALCERVLFPKLQFNLGIITFYLNQIVFPKEGKEFAKRISASGWDVPSSSRDPSLVTTGFSGTNDSRSTLPYSIKQEDLPELLHTNAMVLNLLLREENRNYLQSIDVHGRKLNIKGFLALIINQNPRVNVLIDVGAQVLEATNMQLVQQWLALEKNAHAAVFFDEQDEAMVLDRSGAVTPLRISPFSGKLDACLIYLDEVHTRGIDLAIPVGARAVITLGPRLVKDRLMQACMRLRSLGNGHSLCFVAPPEVHRSISDAAGGKDESRLSSFDVLAWCMEQTCQALDIARPLRAMHGLEMLRQRKVLEQCLPANLTPNAIVSDSSAMDAFWQRIQEDDAQSLENLYGINDHGIGIFQSLLDRDSKDAVMQHLVSEFDTMSKTRLQDSSMDNEQERELEHEIEKERQVQRPAKLKPITPTVSRGLEQYIATGTGFALSQCEAVKAFDCFNMTTAKKIATQQKIKPGDFTVLATRDFVQSVKFAKGTLFDDYLRPTTWVLSSNEPDQTQLLLIISGHETNELLPEIKASDKVRLHVFAARLNKKMARFNRMDFYTPSAKPCDIAPSPHAIRDLELFSGSLYVDNMVKYEQLCHFLGIVTSSTRPRDKPVHTDGFVSSKVRKEIGWPESCPFELSPIPFLKHVLLLRMHGQAFDHSHLGALLNGRALQDAAFEGCQEIEEIFEEMDIDG